MATTTPNFGWSVPTSTDLVKDGATAIETLGDSVDASMADLLGGTSGQILAKNSNTNMDFVWINNDQGDITAVTAGTGISGGGTSGAVTITNAMATEITAKGDLIVGTGNAAFDNLPAGTNGHVLTADSSVSPTGLKWAAPAAGGKVLQVVQATSTTQTSTNSTSFQDTTLSVSITPSSATSKVLIMCSQPMYLAAGATTDSQAGWQLVRASTNIVTLGNTFTLYGNSEQSMAITIPLNYHYLDSPSTTSATTYKTQQKVASATNTIYSQISSMTSTLIALEIGA